jgi:hypothetical protein
MAFISGITLQLKDKIETLEPGLGEQLLEAVSRITNPTGREIIEKLNGNDPTLNESVSGIEPSDLPGAINFLVKRLSNDIKTHLDKLPFLLRNDTTILHSLSVIIGELFNMLGAENLDVSIENFSKNIRIFANKDRKEEEKNNAFKKVYN